MHKRTGLSSQQASENIAKHGYNELPSSKRKNLWRIGIDVLSEPMFILLFSCGLLYIIIGDYREGIVLVSTFFLIVGITFFQHRKTEMALAALKKLSAPRALVVRDGKEMRIAGREVVPEDILIIHEGDRIPADGRLLECSHLQIDESILTGESMPVEKSNELGKNIVLSGTLITRGQGIMIATHTGSQAELGKIGSSMRTLKEEPTPLQKEMKVLIRTIGFISILLSIAVIILFYVTRGDLIQATLNGLSSAMAILPEEFPVVLTIFLALGAWKLSRKNVLTRKASAIETLGAATVLCSDKTGTITQNKMSVKYLSQGNGWHEPASLNQLDDNSKELIICGLLSANPDSVDPMERAILRLNHFNEHSTENAKLLHEYPFSHDILAMTRIYDTTNGKKGYTKGAAETIFNLCGLNPKEIAQLTSEIQAVASKGMRVLALATVDILQQDLPERQDELCYTFCGLIAFEDPIRPEVPKAIETCKNAGIRVMMITGDYPETAKTIAKEIGLKGSKLLTGNDIDALSQSALQMELQNCDILARVRPEHKLRIVEGLKAQGEIVAMTGDGVNDAPALKASHIGIAMGNKGTDVAREAASLVLLDDNFASIVGAIELGRKIFDNLRKAMSYILAIHIPIIGLALLPAFQSNLPILLLPLHIVFLELIIDPVSSIAFETEEAEIGIMNKPPRNPKTRFFGMKHIFESILKGFFLLTAIVLVFYISKKEGHSTQELRAICLSALIIGNIFMAFSELSLTRSFFQILGNHNWQAKIILLSAFVLLLLVLVIPVLSHLFNIKNPGFMHLFNSLVGASILLFALECSKWIRKRLNRKAH